MPRFDGTGPQGKGPMTGRGMGFCVLKDASKAANGLRGIAGVQGYPVMKSYKPNFYYFPLVRFRGFLRLRNSIRNLRQSRFIFLVR